MDRARRICEIARDFRRPGSPSLRDLLDARSYHQVRPELDASRIQAIIESDPELISDWQRFSEDKRTRGGWALEADDDHGWVVWQPFPDVGTPERRHHTRAIEACVDSTLTELDYWSEIDRRRRLATD